MFRCLLIALCTALPLFAADVLLPERPPRAPTGSAFAAGIAALEPADREAAILAEIRRGNVPSFWRQFVPVRLGDAELRVAPDYLAIGSDDDYFLVPLTPMVAQRIADELGCVLPTRRMVNAIYHSAALKLPASPMAPSPAMTTVPVFAAHNSIVAAQRRAALSTHPAGALVAGHKKDIVITPRLAAAANKVAIYGWFRADETAIQPLFLGHASTWADYSHGVRLVQRTILFRGEPTTVEALLADPERCIALSDEGVVPSPRYAAWQSHPPEETWRTLTIDSDVRVTVSLPAAPAPAKPTRLVLYALPAGNTIEQTVGKRLSPGDDWHFDIQHIGAQTRWLRAHTSDANLVVAYLECAGRSWPLWRRRHADAPVRIVALVDALRREFAPTTLVLTGHSAGGAFMFGYLDAVEGIPDDVERIAYLDSNYAYDAAKGHAVKLRQWLARDSSRQLVVVAYQDHLALLDGKQFVSEAGGTWGRSQAMLRDLGETFALTATSADGLQSHRRTAPGIHFLLKENPDHLVWHTRQVELNGFIHALLLGTPAESVGYRYLGARAYEGYNP